MARVQKNAAGEDVRVDTPAYGCKTVEHAAPADKGKAGAKTTLAGAAPRAPAAHEGDE